jgi:uncharacterized protein YbjT (DUF2867 family)
MSTILVTGGTGTLGRDLLPLLPGAITLSRTPGPDRRVGNLMTGQGVAPALEGVDVVIHLADGRDQARATRTLVDAAAPGTHIVMVSIVGIDDIPLGYYRAKRAAEQVLVESGLPHTILRTTQFHPFAAGLIAPPLPVLLAPRLRIQPIDTREVAAALAALAKAKPAGRVADLGGPEILSGAEIAGQLKAARGLKRPVLPLVFAGRIWSGYAAGHHLVPENRAEGRTFAEYLTS